MRTLSLLKGQPIWETCSGTEVGTVKDLFISKDGKVRGLIAAGKGLLHRDGLIPAEYVSSFGPDGVMIQNRDCLMPIPHDDSSYFLHNHKGLFGRTLMTAEGEKLGRLEDVYFQEEVGTIVGYEVSDGFFADITEGKKVVKASSDLTIGKDAIIVNVNT